MVRSPAMPTPRPNWSPPAASEAVSFSCAAKNAPLCT
jgi:hypothetical protein